MNQFRTEPWTPNQNDRRVIKNVMVDVSKTAGSQEVRTKTTYKVHICVLNQICQIVIIRKNTKMSLVTRFIVYYYFWQCWCIVGNVSGYAGI